MSKLDELIAGLCPDGVEHKTLGEIAIDIFRGSGITRDQISSTGTPCVRYGELYTTYGIWFDTTVSFTDEASITNKKYFDHGDILFAITGESVEEIAKSSAYVGHEKCLAGGDIVVLKHTQNPKYLSYALATTDAQIQKSKGKVKSKVVHSSVPAISKISIPLPPLPVQREIVRILDNFTELAAELAARKKQYEYYRDVLFSFNPDVPRKTLGEISKSMYRGSGIKRDQVSATGTPCVRYGEIYTTYNIWFGSCVSHTYAKDIQNKKYFEHGDVLFAITGESVTEIGKSCVYVGHEKCLAGGDIVVMKHNENPKYLAYALSTFDAQTQKSKGKVKSKVVHSSVPALKAIAIPVPPLEEQARIVAILDRFDALCNDLSRGLPAEIEARRKQYEYYRDKLLTFREKSP